MTHTVTLTDEQLATITNALDYYGGWAREGRSDTDDPYYLEVLGKIDDALAALRASQPGTTDERQRPT